MVFHYWTGDDTDATIVADEAGLPLRLPAFRQRSAASAPSAPRRWARSSSSTRARPGRARTPWSGRRRSPSCRGGESGVWATPCHLQGHALRPHARRRSPGPRPADRRDRLAEDPHRARLGQLRGRRPDPHRGRHLRGAPRLGCEQHPRRPAGGLGVSRCPSGSALESTPAVWKGKIYLGSPRRLLLLLRGPVAGALGRALARRAGAARAAHGMAALGRYS